MTSVRINVRISLELQARLDATVESYQKMSPHRKVTRSEMVRAALNHWLQREDRR